MSARSHYDRRSAAAIEQGVVAVTADRGWTTLAPDIQSELPR